MSDCEIVSTRLFNYPREKVFKAWSDADLLKEWWGPKGFTNTFYEFDFRPEGRWKFTMHGPDKGNYENEAIFDEIIEPELITWHRLSQPLFNIVVNFEERGNQTFLRFTMIFDDPKLYATINKFAPASNEENFDRLEAVLAKH